MVRETTPSPSIEIDMSIPVVLVSSPELTPKEEYYFLRVWQNASACTEEFLHANEIATVVHSHDRVTEGM